MIVYVASYPRSGNTWIRNLIHRQFKRLTTEIYPHPRDFEFFKERLKQSFNIDIWIASESPDESEKEKVWNGWTTLYKYADHPEQIYRFLWYGCQEMLTDQNRKMLAQEDEWFFVKTHELPFKRYYPGEYIIQPVRHPGATLWSYHHFLRDFTQEYKDLSLTDLIKGGENVPFGSWSDYHRHWLAATEQLEDRYLRVQYEWLHNHELEFCYQFEKLSKIKVQSTQLKPFEEFHKSNPKLFREGQAYGWEKNYSHDQIQLLFKTHGQMMEQLGYSQS